MQYTRFDSVRAGEDEEDRTAVVVFGTHFDKEIT
jgi:hypothetical protein